ncbi:hypothetical protein GGF50DRAFT_115071 [Schizophyllum commune]
MGRENRIVETEDILVTLGLSRQLAKQYAPVLENNDNILLASVPASYIIFLDEAEDLLKQPEEHRNQGELDKAMEILERLRKEVFTIGDPQIHDALDMRIAYGMMLVHIDKREFREARVEFNRALKLWEKHPWFAEMRILPLDLLYTALARCCEGMGYGYEEQAEQAWELAERYAPQRNAPAKQPEPNPEPEPEPEPVVEELPKRTVKVSTSTPRHDPKRKKKKGKTTF